MIVIRAKEIEDVRVILVVLSPWEKDAYMAIAEDYAVHDAWWLSKLRKMGCWARFVLCVSQAREGGEWSNDFTVDYN